MIYGPEWLTLLKSPLTTVTDNQDIIVGCLLVLHRVACCGLLEKLKGTFLVLVGYTETGHPSLCLSCSVVFGSQAFMTPCLCRLKPDKLSLSFNFGDCFYYILTLY